MTNDELLNAWYKARNELDAFKQRMEPLVEQEMQLRRLVAATFWPTPKEGMNDFDLPLGFKVKYTHKLERKIDQPALPAVLEAMQKHMYSTTDLIRSVPEVNLKVYRELPEPARLIFDQALIIRNASPMLEIIAPKTR
jgi:hypothetical protein